MQKYADYTPAQAAWLDELPSHWQCTKIGALFSERKSKVSDKDYAPLSNPVLLMPFQNATAAGFDAIEFVPPKTLYRLVERFPEEVFDGKAFSTPYLAINLTDENATQRAREASKDRILSFIKDALRIVSGYGQRVQKDELTRASLSVDFLVRELEL